MFLTRFLKLTTFIPILLLFLIVSANLIYSFPLEFDFNAPADVFERIELKTNSNLRGFALDLTNNQKWTNGIVPFTIDQVYSARETSIIYSAMRIIEISTGGDGKNCIKFVPRSTETTFLRIYNGNGCWSYVGRRFTGAQLLSLKKPTIDSPASCLFIGTVTHELVHALGFDHEHVRPDRDNFIKIIWDRINNPLINLNNFNIIQNGLDLGFGYDYESIMHYHSTAFSIDGSPTIIPLKSGVELKNNFDRTYLSQIDIEEIRKFYGCEIDNTKTSTRRINPCNSSPCQNDGTCLVIGNGYSCSCTTGCTGTNCAQCTRPGRLQLQDFNRHACEHIKKLNLCYSDALIGNIPIKQACPVSCNSKCFDEFGDNCLLWKNFCALLNQLENNPCRKTCSAC